MGSTTIDEKALAAYEALCAGATVGPWEIEREELGEDFSDEEQDTAFPMTIGPIQSWEHVLDNLTDDHVEQVETDAAFISSSRTMGPLLAAKVREQAKEIEDLKRSRMGMAYMIESHVVAGRDFDILPDVLEHVRAVVRGDS